MLNYLNKIKSESLSFIGIISITLVLGISTLEGNTVLTDPFHHGEFFAAAIGFFTDINISFHPLAIHGALDYIPAIFAEYIWGPDSYFLPTFAIYKIIDFLASVILILISYEFTKLKKHQWPLLLAISIIAPLFVGYRDLFLLTSIYTFIKIVNNNDRQTLNIALLASFGITVGLGIFWSYDRGIAGTMSLGTGILFLLLRNHWYAISILTFAATVIGLGLIFQTFSFKNYINDIHTLIQASGQWGYGLKLNPILLTTFAVIFNITAIFSLVGESLKAKLLTERLPIIACLGILSLFMLKIGTNRADLSHIYFSCWVPTLIFLFLYENISLTKNQTLIFIGVLLLPITALAVLHQDYGFAMISGILAVSTVRFKIFIYKNILTSYFTLLVTGCFSLIIFKGIKGFSDDQYSWIKNLSSPQSNRLTATGGVVWASDRLQEHSIDCVFDMSNNGVINGLLRLPSCSRFTYPVYASINHEPILISDLKNASPPAVLYSSTYWSYSIDGKDMKIRFPNLDRFILINYPNEECNFGYCIRYKGK